MIDRIKIKLFIAFLLCNLLAASHIAQAELIDKIIAIVENDVILEGELSQETAMVEQRLRAANANMPPPFVVRRQVLEKLILDKLQRQLAEKSGITVSEEMLNNSVAEVAHRNNMNTQEFRNELQGQGISYKSFLDNLRNEIIINQLRGREIGGRIKVTDQEIQHYLETQDQGGSEPQQYHLGHILIAVKEAASPSEIQKAQIRAEQTVDKLRSGEDFAQTAMSSSDDANALKGGDLGWRSIGDIPTLFVESVKKMVIGNISDPIRSPSGFHIIKVLDIKGGTAHQMVTKTEVRHILIKTNEIIDDNEAKKRLLALKARIEGGEDFAALARAHSDDKGSALKGGSLGWVGPGDLVKPFEDAMQQFKINEIRDPVQTQFGWHLIQVLGRENKDNSAEYRKNLARDAIRNRKVEEETELWLRKLRDEAYVEIYQDRL